MKLKFFRPFLSLNKLNCPELPSFTLITGVNGSGKTHLLKAIENGDIQVDFLPHGNNKSLVKYFDWNSFVPPEPTAYNNFGEISDKKNQYERISGALDDARDQMRNAIPRDRLEITLMEDDESTSRELIKAEYRRIQKASLFNSLTNSSFENRDKLKEAIRQALQSPDYKELAIDDVEQLARECEEEFLNKLPPDIRRYINEAASQLDKPAFSVTDSDLKKIGFPLWGRTNLFEHSLTQLFIEYSIITLRKRFERLKACEAGQCATYIGAEPSRPVAEQERTPWTVINAILEKLGLPFKINIPDEIEFYNYVPALIDQRNGKILGFSHLSSGEKIILSLAICLFNINDQRQTVDAPRLVLLDEVDAPLHPSMSRILIEVIKDEIVKRSKIPVIAATHSPSTIAIAPEESIFVLESGELKKTTKGAALNILTTGVPTLALNFEGRRQVFAESNDDALIFDRIYQVLKPKLDSERTLQFVGCGLKTDSGDSAAGCAIVKKMTRELREAGNKAIFGLIDYDTGRHNANQGVVILGVSNARNGLENYLFDPLVMIGYILRFRPEQLNNLGLSIQMTYSAFMSIDISELQIAIDEFSMKLFGETGGQRVSSKYEGGIELQIDERFCTTDDHELEKIVHDRIHALRGKTGSAKGTSLKDVKSTIAEQLFKDKPDLIPIGFRETFEALLNYPSH